MSNIRKLVVEKWFDALRDNPEDFHPDFSEEPEEHDGIWALGSDLQEMEKSEIERIKQEHKTGMKVLNTPSGVIPLTEYSFASRVFNFWLVHTNFAVTDDMIAAIADIDGIEDILPITKHRFRISVGRLFTVPEVVNKIQELLCLPSNNEVEAAIYQRLKELKDQISNMNYWAIYVVPNGRIIHMFSDESNEDFNTELRNYTAAHSMVGGILWTHNEMEPTIN